MGPLVTDYVGEARFGFQIIEPELATLAAGGRILEIGAGTLLLTERVFRRRILASRTVVDPRGTWTSLNWISVASVRRIARTALSVEPAFDQTVLHRFVSRAIGDSSFQRRHSPLIRQAFTLLDAAGVTAAFKLVPVSIQPVMSCRLERPH